MSILYVQELVDEIPEAASEGNDGEATVSSFHYNDVVYRHLSNNSGVEFGIVQFPDVLPDYSCLEDVLQNGFRRGRFKVKWFKDGLVTEHLAGDRDIRIQSRDLAIGSRARKSLSSKYGRVISTTRFYTVAVAGQLDDFVVSNVGEEFLKPLYKATLGDYIQYGEWIGVVTKVQWTSFLRNQNNPFRCQLSWSQSVEEPTSNSAQLVDRIWTLFLSKEAFNATALDVLNVLQFENMTERLKTLASRSLSFNVVDIQPVYVVEWLNRIPCSCYQVPQKPDSKIQDGDPKLKVLRRPQDDRRRVGEVCFLDWDAARNNTTTSTWEYTSLSEWQLNFGNCHVSFASPKASGSSMMDNSSMKKVKILAYETWVTLGDHIGGGSNLTYVNSRELEPLLLAEAEGEVSVGTVVMDDDQFDEERYGVVAGFDDIDKSIWVHWFELRARKQTSAKFIERVKYCNADHNLGHHSLFQLKPGHIVIAADPIPEYSLDSFVGVLEAMSEDGMYRIRTSDRNSVKVWPHFVERFPWAYCYDWSAQSWQLKHALVDCAHLPNVVKLEIPFEPVATSLAHFSGARFRHHLGRFQPKLIENNAMEVEREERYTDFSTKLLEDLRLYTGKVDCGINLKATKSNFLEAAIQGPENTLYQDTILYFTIQIPFEYPEQPPKVLYRPFISGDINPCLLTNGSVIFPLLNTYPKFVGVQMECWNPKEHSVGLVLAALQKILLCQLPYQHDPKFPFLQLMSTNIAANKCCQANLKYLENLISTVEHQIMDPLPVWRKETREFYKIHIPRFCNRIFKALETRPQDEGLIIPNLKTGKSQEIQQRLKHLLQLYSMIYC